MTDELKQKIVAIIEKSLNADAISDNDKIKIFENDSMETVSIWDSLRFMSVFSAINEEFNLEPDFDDAVNYVSISALYEYLKDKVTE